MDYFFQVDHDTLVSDPCAQQRALHRAGGNPARKENNHLIR